MNNPQSRALWQKLLAALKDSSVGKFAGGAADMLLPEKMSDILTGPAYAARHPIDSAAMLGRGMQDASQYQFEKMYNAPSTSEAIGHGMAGAIPMLGPAAGMAGEEIGQGNTARGMGMATALLAPSLYRGGKAGVKWTGEAAQEVMAPRRAAAEAMAKKLQEAKEWEAFNKANPNAATNAGKPSPYTVPVDELPIPSQPLFRGGPVESALPEGTYYTTSPEVAGDYAKLHGMKRKNVHSITPNAQRDGMAQLTVDGVNGPDKLNQILKVLGKEPSGDVNLDAEASLPYFRNKGYRVLDLPDMPTPGDMLSSHERVVLKPTGSLAQLPGDPTGIGGSPLFNGLDRSTIVNWGDEAGAPAPTASALPSRRDALKAGGAAGLGAMLVPKLLEAPKAPIPLMEAAPVLGRNAASALGREGFYRETKNRAVGYSDPYVVTDPKQLPTLTRTFDESGKPYSDLATVSDSHAEYIGARSEPGRFFMARVEGQGGDGPGYGKGIFRLNRGENLREAMRTWVQSVKESDASGDFGGIDPDLPATRSVISEITPEAALRLNTIEKRKLPLFTVDRRGRTLIEGLDVPVDEMASSGMDFYLNDGAAAGKGHAAVYATPKGKAPTKFIREKLLIGDARKIDPSEAASIVDLTGKHQSSIPLSRPDTVGISPRYNKRVSIRLLKDTMAEQIKENKRAAGLKPPPLLAKAPVLQDNPKLSRFDFLRGTQSETDFMGNPIKKKR